MNQLWCASFLMVVLLVPSAFAHEHGHGHGTEHLPPQTERHSDEPSKPADSSDDEHPAPPEPADESRGHSESKDAAMHHASQAKPGFFWRLLTDNAVVRVYTEFEAKLDHAARVDQDNEELRKRVAVLELRYAELEEYSGRVREQARAERLKKEAKEEGGDEKSRTIASLNMADEELLSRPPKLVFDAAVKAFDEGDYETAGKALAFLASNSENDAYQNVQTFYLAGVSLYKVGNYKRALSFLEKAERGAKGGDGASYAPRALGWKALCYKKLGNTAAEKHTIHELIQKYPKSKEARRLNRNA